MVVFILKVVYLHLWFFCKSALEIMKKLSELNNFQARKTTVSATFLIRFRGTGHNPLQMSQVHWTSSSHNLSLKVVFLFQSFIVITVVNDMLYLLGKI